MSEYTPTTEQVKDAAVEWFDWQVVDGSEAFDRWFAEVERAAAEKALNKAADELRVSFSRGAAIAMHNECHKKQCRCGNPGNDEIVREVFEAAREAIRNEALAYRRNEGENDGNRP